MATPNNRSMSQFRKCLKCIEEIKKVPFESARYVQAGENEIIYSVKNIIRLVRLSYFSYGLENSNFSLTQL